MNFRLTRKLALILLAGCVASISVLFFYGFDASITYAFSPYTLMINYGSGIIFAICAFYWALKILKGDVPFGFNLFLKKNNVYSTIVLFNLMILATINLLYLLYYPQFQNKIDLSSYKIFTPFLTSIVISMVFGQAICITIYFHDHIVSLANCIRLGVEYTIVMLCFEQIINIFIAYVLWS